LAEKPLFQVYPNPASETLTVTSDELIGRIVVSNSHGALLLEAKVSGKIYLADFRSIPSGVYFVRIITEEGDAVLKALITH
jgi:hypothetical protein